MTFGVLAHSSTRPLSECASCTRSNLEVRPGFYTELALRTSPPPTLVGACPATGDRIFVTGCDSVSKLFFAILWLFLLDFMTCNHALKGPQKPKLLGWDPCGDRILRSSLQKGLATAPANYPSPPPNLARKFPSVSQNDFLGGGYPNRSSGIHH